MSTNWFKDMQAMHKKYGVDEWMKKEKYLIGLDLISLWILELR